jgi:predicted phosphodiesterase
VRLGLISDIHGNRLALDAVLEELEREGVDEFICLGDVAVGPQPAEALERVRELDCPVVMGNWDAAFLGDMPTPKDKIGEQLVEIGEWWASYLSPADREYMAGFAPTVKLEVGSTPVLFFHGSPRSYDEWIFSTTPDDELRSMFADIEERILIGGHTHVQMVRRYQSRSSRTPGAWGSHSASGGRGRCADSPWAEYGVPHLGGRAAEHRLAPNAVRRRRLPRAEPEVRACPTPSVGEELVDPVPDQAGDQRRETVVTVPSGAMRRM